MEFQDSSLATPDYTDEAPTHTQDAASTDTTMDAAPSAGKIKCYDGPKRAILDEVLTSARAFCTAIEGKNFNEKSTSLVLTQDATSGNTNEFAISWILGCVGPLGPGKLGPVDACVESFARIQATCEFYPFIEEPPLLTSVGSRGGVEELGNCHLYSLRTEPQPPVSLHQ
jgi:hypothetical protein